MHVNLSFFPFLFYYDFSFIAARARAVVCHFAGALRAPCTRAHTTHDSINCAPCTDCVCAPCAIRRYQFNWMQFNFRTNTWPRLDDCWRWRSHGKLTVKWIRSNACTHLQSTIQIDSLNIETFVFKAVFRPFKRLSRHSHWVLEAARRNYL